MLHVVFTEDGTPDWIGSSLRDGAVPVDKDMAFLVAHRRTAKGAWIKRVVPMPVKPSSEELWPGPKPSARPTGWPVMMLCAPLWPRPRTRCSSSGSAANVSRTTG